MATRLNLPALGRSHQTTEQGLMLPSAWFGEFPKTTRGGFDSRSLDGPRRGLVTTFVENKNLSPDSFDVHPLATSDG